MYVVTADVPLALEIILTAVDSTSNRICFVVIKVPCAYTTTTTTATVSTVVIETAASTRLFRFVLGPVGPVVNAKCSVSR